jgi:hypothetical protein
MINVVRICISMHASYAISQRGNIEKLNGSQRSKLNAGEWAAHPVRKLADAEIEGITGPKAEHTEGGQAHKPGLSRNDLIFMGLQLSSERAKTFSLVQQ